MASEEEKDSNSAETQPGKADNEKYSGIDRTGDSGNKEGDSVNDVQSGNDESKKKVLNIVIID